MDFILEDICERAVRIAQELGCSYCDVRAENSIREGISIEDGQIEHSDISKDAGIGIRVLSSGAWGFFSISNPKPDDIKKSVEIAVKNSQNKSKKTKLSEVPS